MTDIYLDPGTKDLWIGAQGQSRLTQTLLEEVTQRLDTKLRFFLGEWQLNKLAGIPYYRDIFKKNPNLTAVQGVFAAAITSDPGIANLDSIALVVDSARKLTLSFAATLTDGSVIQSASNLT